MAARKNDFASEAEALPAADYSLAMPLHTLLGEAVDVAKFFKTYWKAKKGPGGKVKLPGLESVKAKLPVNTGEDILALVKLSQGAHQAYLLALSAKSATARMERGAFLVDEVSGAIEFFLDDGVTDENDEKLANVKGAHKDNLDSIDGMAAALGAWAALAGPMKKDLKRVADLDPALITEAAALSEDLLALTTNAGPLTAAQKAALDKRNRLLRLLAIRVGLVRASARWVFRATPAIIREATSAYERRRRAASKRAAAKKTTGATPG